VVREGIADAVIVAAPPQVHCEVAAMALKAGIHVFVEKPPTVTTEELRRLASLAAGSRLVTGVGHNLRHATASAQMQHVLRDPAFGRPVFMAIEYLASKPLGDRWGLRSPFRSFLLSHAVHALDLLVFQLGPVDSVNASSASGADGRMTLAVQLRFKGGAIGTVLATTCAPHFAVSMMAVGDRATVVRMGGLHEMHMIGFPGTGKHWGTCWTERTLDSGFGHAGYQQELDQFVGAVRGRMTMSPSFADEIAVYELMDEIERRVGEML
jgi:predicted dehydrogenase